MMRAMRTSGQKGGPRRASPIAALKTRRTTIKVPEKRVAPVAAAPEGAAADDAKGNAGPAAKAA